MTEIACPSCGAPLILRSAALPHVSCSHCQSLIRRDGSGFCEIGKVAVLPFDVSPIQIGTVGQWDGQTFEIVGRVRWGWSDGAWNEWLMLCSDGSQRWLGEAMGSFIITAERDELLAIPTIAIFAKGGTIARGTIVSCLGTDYVAADIKRASCLGAEGELARPTPVGAMLDNVDLRSPRGAVLSVQRDEAGTMVWAGQSVALAQMAPRNLRQLDGWSLPPALRPA